MQPKNTPPEAHRAVHPPVGGYDAGADGYFHRPVPLRLEPKATGKLLPHPLSRGERGVNFRLMEASGGTFAFTSTSEGEMLDSFVAKKQEPHALHMTICEGVPYLDFTEFLGEDYHYTDQREILLPPMVRMEHDGIGPVHHYEIRFTGVDSNFEFVDEAVLTATLTELRDVASEGLDDLAQNRDNAAVFHDPDHPYWQWKAAFCQMAMQGMAETYRSLYG